VEDFEESVALNFAVVKAGVSLSDEFMNEINDVPEIEIKLVP